MLTVTVQMNCTSIFQHLVQIHKEVVQLLKLLLTALQLSAKDYMP